MKRDYYKDEQYEMDEWNEEWLRGQRSPAAVVWAVGMALCTVAALVAAGMAWRC